MNEIDVNGRKLFSGYQGFCILHTPEDLKGKKIGIAEYQLSANVWARAILEDEYGVKPSDVIWIRGGMNSAGRPEKIKIQLPNDVTMPFVEDHLDEAKRLMGENFWTYGIKGNENTLATFLDHHHRQGLSSRRLSIEELFQENYSL